MMEWWEPGACIDTPLSSSGLHTRACILLQKLVLYSRNKASRRQMSSTLPSFPPGQMAKLDNMLSKITLKSHGRVSVCLPVCPSIRPAWRPGHLCRGVAPGQGRRGVVWDDGEAGASLIAVD